MQTALRKLLNGGSLTEDEAMSAMSALMDGEATAAQIGALLAALRVKGETVDEITGFARVMRDRSLRVRPTRSPLVDTCGTGGDTIKTFNISTTAGLVAAAAGAAVAKHGNRSVTSKCGSADVLEALGVRLDLTPPAVARCIDSVGIGFLFARGHHPAMKHAAGPRADLGARTVFNALGPLTNPAGATRQVIGVYDGALCAPLARVLANLGGEHILVVHGVDGLDEIATFCDTIVAEYRDGSFTEYRLTAHYLGLPDSDAASVGPAADAAGSATLLRNVISGADRGPRRDIVLANAGAAIYVAGLADDIRAGIALAAAAIDSGAATSSLEALRGFTEATLAPEAVG